MQANAGALAALLGVAAALLAGPVDAAGRLGREAGPVEKVVGLLQEMKEQVEKEAEADKEAYDKYACWCETNKDAKTGAIEAAEKRITALEAFIEEAAGIQGTLKTEIAALEAGIVEDQDALSKATGIREKEAAEFETAEKDAKECVATLRQAIEVLAKVQLIQRRGTPAAVREARPLLLQLRAAVHDVHVKLGVFRGVMQRDLWDVMSSIDQAVGGVGAASEELPGAPGRRVSALEQRGQLRAGEVQPTGAAAGAKSYSSQSGSIFGILSEMKEEFERNLGADQQEELQAMIGYQKLRASKMSEISTAQGAKDQKEATLADTIAKEAQSKEDLEATTEALDADQKFVLELTKNCKTNEEDYAERSKIRSEELVALAETIKILTEDDARDLFGKTMALLQTGSVRSIAVKGAAVGRAAGHTVGRAGSAADAARNQALDSAMRRILHVARKHHNWVLASLAVRVRLDAFVKVKEAMDRMTAELKAQQKAESEKKDFCNKEIDQTEDGITEKGQAKEDLESKKLGLQNSIASLGTDLEELQAEVSNMQVSLKQAGEDRSAENLLFQQAISDQRATINILEKAKARLAKFYMTKPALAQAHQRQEPAESAPGRAVAPPPPKPQAYEKSGGGRGVIQLLDKILNDAAKEETKLLTTEQGEQASYAALVKDINSAIQADQAAIVEKTKLLQEAKADKSETEASLLTNSEELARLGETLKGMHLDCDYLLKYYDVRQQARQEELSAIAEAKAILSGADFGKALEEADDAAGSA